MSETIDCTREDFPGMFLLEAIASLPRAAISEKFKNRMVEVTLLINGEEFPFEATMAGFWQRAAASLDRDILEKATELVTESGLKGIQDALQDAEWRIKEALRAAQVATPTHPETQG
jgi:hypothetical protein